MCIRDRCTLDEFQFENKDPTQAAWKLFNFIRCAKEAVDCKLDHPLEHALPRAFTKPVVQLSRHAAKIDDDMVKSYDYTCSTRPHDQRRQPNQLLFRLAWGEEPASLVVVKVINPDLCLLSYPYFPGDHKPKTVEQFTELCQQVGRLHKEDWVHSDVRQHNVVFSMDGKITRLIDFDLAGKVGSVYPDNFAPLPCRHKDAKSGEGRQISHDRQALSFLLEEWFEKSDVMDNVKAQLLGAVSLDSISFDGLVLKTIDDERISPDGSPQLPITRH
eukprot:TRINITY_DN4778_c0_g1_i1.p1 TRINITY_DN4778_c0_g1~~TRINITY_DN4778_c0_g1_i1.p1  ORF type:complete len:273 (-),score=11.39 TRINITY_DN4778_c0_g1_i1:54-872(-)